MNNLVNLIKAIRKNKWWIIIPFVLSIIISSIFTLFVMKAPMYQTTLKFFPSRLPSEFSIFVNLYMYDFLTSKEVKTSVLKKFDHKANPKTSLSSNNYDSRINILEDQNIATIFVKHEDSITSVEIAQYLVELYSERSKELKRAYHREHADFCAGMIEASKSSIDSIKKELFHLAKDSNFYVQTFQTKELTRALMGTYGNNASIDKKEVEKTKQMLINSGGDMFLLEKLLDLNIQQLEAYQHEYNHSINELSKMNLYASVFSTTCSVESVFKRNLYIVLISAIATLLVSITIIIFIDTYKPLFKEIKEKLSKE